MPDQQPPQTEEHATEEEVAEDYAQLPATARLLYARHASVHIVLRYGQPNPWRLASNRGRRDVLRARRLADLFPDRPLSGATK